MYTPAFSVSAPSCSFRSVAATARPLRPMLSLPVDGLANGLVPDWQATCPHD